MNIDQLLYNIKEQGVSYLTKEDRKNIINIAVCCLEEQINKSGLQIKSSDEASDYLKLQFANEVNEVFSVLFLNNNNKFIAFEKLFFGTINQSIVFPRVVLKKALELDAAAVIFAHNHPGGNKEPSSNDIKITKELSKILSIVDVKVLDHLVVAGNECVSFAEERLL